MSFERWTAYKIRKSETRRRDMQKRRRLRNRPLSPFNPDFWYDPIEVVADLVCVAFFVVLFSSISC